MRQDRRLNGWVLIGSIIQIILGVGLLAVGVSLAVAGFMYADKLAKLNDLQFFINQKGIIEAQQSLFNNKLLEVEYLYLAFGIILGVVGLIALILSIASLTYSKKRAVVRHRVALVLFTIIPLAISGCATAYLVLELSNLTDIVKYVVYGVIGAFGFVALCNILGLLFGRSEQFMSNDNNKYAFDNSSLRNARADINNNVRATQQQTNAQTRPMQPQGVRPVEQQNQAVMMQQRAQARQMPQGARPIQPRPMQSARPAQPVRPNAVPTNPNQTGVSRPVGVARPAQPMRPNTNIQGQPARPISRPGAPTNATGSRRYCQKCGKLLAPNERYCTLCGYLDKQGN